MKNNRLSFPALVSLLLFPNLISACGFPANPTLNHSLNGVQSQLTPRTKGETLLEGVVIWPTEAIKPSSMQFGIKLFVDKKLTSEIRTNALGQFALKELPSGSHLRMEAHLIDRQQLVFKQEIMLSKTDPLVKSEISLESTAAVALMDYDKKMGNLLASQETKDIMQANKMPMIYNIKDSMLPYLNLSANQTLESMPAVALMIQHVHSQLILDSGHPH